MPVAFLRAVHAAALVTVLAFLVGCEGPPHAAPAFPTAEAGDGFVDLSWGTVTGVKKYVIQWTDNAGGNGEIKDLQVTSYQHTGLTNLRTYTYRVIGETGGGRGPASIAVQATPGPVPGAVEWAVVVTGTNTHQIHFASAALANKYRVYVATSSEQLAGRRPGAFFEEATASPHLRSGITPSTALYYRVIAMNDTRIGFDGPVAISATPRITTHDLPATAPALGDPNADKCLDLVSATGNCQGLLAARDMAAAGLSGLLAAGRSNGDSRYVDLNADGKVDLFSNTLSLATDAGSRAILHVNQGTGVFAENATVAGLGIGGFGGTLLAADFDNDGDVDLFAPHDDSRGDGARNWLLLNDGGGILSDNAAAAGLASNPAGAAYVPRGGQAVDFNGDGRVDLAFGSRLLINNGNGTFTDGSAAAAWPLRADQGLKLFDVDLDGDFDLVHHDGAVTRLYRNTGGVFDAGTIVHQDTSQATFGHGLNVCDYNGDGFEDVLVAYNVTATGKGAPRLLLNVNGQLLRSVLPTTAAVADDLLAANDLLACGDMDDNGVIDVLARWGTTYRLLRASQTLPANIKLRVVGSGGERNQQGRVVRLVPRSAPNRVIARVIESGSGLHAQNQYDLLVGAPWLGTYDVSVRFRNGTVTGTATPGSSLTIYEDGRVVTGLQ